MKSYTSDKIIGIPKSYRADKDFFVKHFKIKRLLNQELFAHHFLKRHNIRIRTPIIVRKTSQTITYKRIYGLNAQNLLFKKKLKTPELLNIVKNLAKFHQDSREKRRPQVETIKFRIKKFINEMYKMKDFSSQNKDYFVSVINSELKFILSSSFASFIHGDFFLENIFVTSKNIVYYDWEFSQFSSPSYDLTLLLDAIFMYGVRYKVLGFREYVLLEQKIFNKYFSNNKKVNRVRFLREIRFFRTFDDHCMYLFYLTILVNKYKPEFRKIMRLEKKSRTLAFRKLIKQMNCEGYFPKANSVLRIIEWISEYPEGLDKILLFTKLYS